MNITKTDIDNLNAVLTVDIVKDDYADKVQKILNDYRKNANIPGFRKGHVPMGMVKKQYGKAVLVEEINKIIQEALHKYLTDEKLDILGNPLPKDNEVNWDAEDFSFEFEIGLSPDFSVDLKANEVPHFKIVATDEMIDNQIKTIRKQYGKIVAQTEVHEGDEVVGTFTSTATEEDAINIEKEVTFEVSEIDGDKQRQALIGAKVGETITLETKGMFEDDHDNQKYFGVSHDEAHGLAVEVALHIKESNKRELAEVNQELFDKIFGEGEVASEEELRAKIKEDAEKQFEQQSDQQLLNAVVDSLIDKTEFDLPQAFLEKWLAQAGENQLSEEEAKAEYERSERGLRYQLIEGKIRTENDLNVTFEEMKDYASGMIRSQMAQFGQTDPSDEDVNNIVARVLSNKEEVQRLSEQLQTAKLLEFFKQNANLKTKEVTFEEFVKEAYE